MSLCSQPSASGRRYADAFSACPSHCQRPRCTGAPFSKTSRACGTRGVEYVVSDDHAGLRAARKAVLGGVKGQRSQFHPAQNAIHHSSNLAIRKRIGAELRTVWNVPTLKAAEIALADLVKAYQFTAPKLADWLEKNVPEGLTVFARLKNHRRRMRTPTPWSAPYNRKSSGAHKKSGCFRTRLP